MCVCVSSFNARERRSLKFWCTETRIETRYDFLRTSGHRVDGAAYKMSPNGVTHRYRWYHLLNFVAPLFLPAEQYRFPQYVSLSLSLVLFSVLWSLTTVLVKDSTELAKRHSDWNSLCRVEESSFLARFHSRSIFRVGGSLTLVSGYFKCILHFCGQDQCRITVRMFIRASCTRSLTVVFFFFYDIP